MKMLLLILVIINSFCLLGCAWGSRNEGFDPESGAFKLIRWEYILVGPGVCGVIYNHKNSTELRVQLPRNEGLFSPKEVLISGPSGNIDIRNCSGAIDSKSGRIEIHLKYKSGEDFYYNGNYN